MPHTFHQPEVEPITTPVGKAFEAVLKNKANLEQLDFLRDVMLVESVYDYEGPTPIAFILRKNYAFPTYRDEIVNVLRTYAETYVPDLRAPANGDPRFTLNNRNDSDAAAFLAQTSSRQAVGHAVADLLYKDDILELRPDQMELLDQLRVKAEAYHCDTGTNNQTPTRFALEFKPREISQKTAVFKALQQSSQHENSPILDLRNIGGRITFGISKSEAGNYFRNRCELQSQCFEVGS